MSSCSTRRSATGRRSRTREGSSITSWSSSLLLLDLLAEPLLLLAKLRRELVAEVIFLEDLANLDLALAEGRALQPVDRRFLRLHLDQPEAGDQIRSVAERAVGDGRLVAVGVDPDALRARMQ